jgi:hypothetical protein
MIVPHRRAVVDGVHAVPPRWRRCAPGRISPATPDRVKSLSTNLGSHHLHLAHLTIVGFLGPNYSALPVPHLANMTCVGVTMAFLYSFIASIT